MITIERGKLDAAIRLTLLSSGIGVTGLTPGDMAVDYFAADGTLGTMGGISLVEVDSANFPGVYLLKDYDAALVEFEGPAGIVVTGGTFDNHEVELEISAEREHVRMLYQLGYYNLVWNVDESRWDLKDDSDVLIGWFPATDANGNDAILDGTQPVTRLFFVPAP